MWVDRGDYWESTAPQGSEIWHQCRRGRVNGSNTGALAGKTTLKSIEDTGKIIAGVLVEEFKQKNIDAMSHGHEYESTCRIWYEKNHKCKVLERGLAVCKTDYRIGASIDGEIVGKDGIIEIKAPLKLWKPILQYMDSKSQGWNPPKNYHDHIWETHYCQMQQSMFVLKKKYCDYIVYSTEDAKVFTQRIFFDSVYWNNHYEIIKKNYEKYVRPYLVTPYPLIPSVYS